MNKVLNKFMFDPGMPTSGSSLQLLSEENTNFLLRPCSSVARRWQTPHLLVENNRTSLFPSTRDCNSFTLFLYQRNMQHLLSRQLLCAPQTPKLSFIIQFHVLMAVMASIPVAVCKDGMSLLEALLHFCYTRGRGAVRGRGPKLPIDREESPTK